MSELSPLNDPEIGDDEKLYRRINPNWLPGGKLSSQAFQNYTGNDAFSIHIDGKLGDMDMRDLLENFPGYRLAVFTAGQARALAQGVIHVPEPDDPSHGHVNGNKSKGVRKGFARIAQLID